MTQNAPGAAVTFPLPAVETGTVVGRFGVADDGDGFTPLTSTVTFVPLKTTIRMTDIQLMAEPVVCTLDSEGYLCGPTGERSVTLIAGRYRLFSSPPAFPSRTIDVVDGAVIDLGVQ